MVVAGTDVRRISYPEYLDLEDQSDIRHEYINGEAVAMSGGTIEHARLAAKIVGQLDRALEGKPCAVYTSDVRLRMERTGRSTYADVVVICGKPVPASDDRQGVTNPKVVVEVLSDGTEKDDRGNKWLHYQSLDSLQEYVLVSQHEPQVEVYRREGMHWNYWRYGAGQRVQLQSIGVELDLDTLYADRPEA